MTYQPAGSGYPAPQQTGSFAAAAAPAGPSKLPAMVTTGVAALGLISYLVSFGPQMVYQGSSSSASSPWWVTPALVAGLLAAVSLLPKVRSYAPVVAVLSVLSLAEVVSVLFGGIPDRASVGWALWLALVLTLVQAALAVVALLFETGTLTAPAPRPRAEQYPQYGQYGQPPVGYYGQQAVGQQSVGQQAPGQFPGYAPQQPPAPAGYPSAGPAGYAQADTSPETPPNGFPGFGQPQQYSDPAAQNPS